MLDSWCQTLSFSVVDAKCPTTYPTIFPECQTSYHCVDVSTGTVQGTSGFYIVFQVRLRLLQPPGSVLCTQVSGRVLAATVYALDVVVAVVI